MTRGPCRRRDCGHPWAAHAHYRGGASSCSAEGCTCPGWTRWRWLAWMAARCAAYDAWFDSLPPEVQAELIRRDHRHLLLRWP